MSSKIKLLILSDTIWAAKIEAAKIGQGKIALQKLQRKYRLLNR